MSAVLPQVFIGVDGSDRWQDLHASDREGAAVLRFRVSTNAAGLDTLLERLEATWPGVPRAFGFEDPTSPFALALQARGECVYSTNPHALKQLREGLNPSGKKDDPADAHAGYLFLRENFAKLTPVTPNSDTGVWLRSRVLERLELVREKTRLVNRITALLKQVYPVVLHTFSKLDQELTLTFLARWPSTLDLARLTLPEFRTFLAEQRYSRPQRAEALWQRLQTPQLPLPAGVALRQGVPLARLLAQLQLVRQQLKQVEAEIEHLFQAHPDAPLFTSLPASGERLAPALLTVFGDDRKAWRNVDHLTAQCGTVPVTQRSGKRRCTVYRFHCDRDRRYLLHLFANVSRQHCDWAQSYYQRQRDRGQNHATALRNLATKWLRIIWRMWHDRQLYCPDKIQENRKETAGPNSSQLCPLTSR
jgi:transposase